MKGDCALNVCFMNDQQRRIIVIRFDINLVSRALTTCRVFMFTPGYIIALQRISTKRLN
jgi:hypothetical protein